MVKRSKKHRPLWIGLLGSAIVAGIVAAIALGATTSLTINSGPSSKLRCTSSGTTSDCPNAMNLADNLSVTVRAVATTTTSSTTTSSTTTTPTTTTSTTSSTTTTSGYWQPPQFLRWYWQLSSVPTTPRANIDVTDFDGFDGTASSVATYHSAGQKTICYIDVGTWENWRSDASQFPSGLLGNTNGWPGERWLNISPSGPYYSTLQSIMDKRFQMCQSKGFDALEPDNMDGYQNSTGFSLSASDQLTYNKWVLSEAHKYGLAYFQKNDPDQSASLLAAGADGVISEQAYQYGDDYSAYENAGKPHLDAEYSSSVACHSPAAVMQARFSVNLDGSTFVPCW